MVVPLMLFQARFVGGGSHVDVFHSQSDGSGCHDQGGLASSDGSVVSGRTQPALHFPLASLELF